MILFTKIQEQARNKILDSEQNCSPNVTISNKNKDLNKMKNYKKIKKKLPQSNIDKKRRKKQYKKSIEHKIFIKRHR